MVEQDTISRFNSFVTAARPLVVGHIQQEIAKLQPRIDLISQWLVPDDLLALTGVSRVEDAYTELLAWALDPPGQKDVALICQRAWLKALGIGEGITKAVRPQTQFSTDDGRPDLIFDYRHDGFVVAVEAKTGSDEHETPGGGFQSVNYPAAVRSALHLPTGFPVKMVFLTPSGTAAENPDAINTTYAEFVLALASELPPDSLPPYLRANYAMLFTHLLGNADPVRNAEAGIRVLKDLIDAGTVTSEAVVLDKLSVIRPGLTALRGVRTMAPFTGFSETARLYGQDAKIVDEAFRAFYEDMVHFWQALEGGIRKLVREDLLKSSRSDNVDEAEDCPRYRYLWLADDRSPKHAFLLFDLWNNYSLVTPENTLKLRACTPELPGEQLARLWDIPSRDDLKGFCTLKGRKTNTFMRIQLVDAPITFAAKQVAAVLKAMYTAETGTLLP